MLTTKELPIQQAVEGEKSNKTVYTFDEFKAELAINKVDDIFSDTKIKQDKEKYIFTINGENKFAINGEINLVNWIQKIYTEIGEKEKRTAEEQVLIRIQGLKLEYIKTKTQEDLALLKENISKVKTSVEKATDIENVKYKVERLIAFYEQEKDLAQSETSGWIFNTKYDRKDKGLRKIQKTEIKRRLKELKKIKEQIERLANNKDKKYSIDRKKQEVKTVEMDDVNAMDMKMTLKQLSDKIEDLGLSKEAPDFILARNEIILEQADTTPYFEIIGYDKSDAKKLNKALKKVNNEYAILDELKLTGAKRQELSQDLKKLEEYLTKVMNNPNTFKPSENPFVPTNTKEFCALMNIKPTPAQYEKANKEASKTPNVKNTKTSIGTATIEKDDIKKQTEYTSSRYSSAGEAFKKGGINGLSKYGLDQTNMKPEQKQFWSGVGNLAVTGGAIFLGWKMLSSAFKMVFKSDKEKKTGVYDSANRARLGIPTALIFGSQARTGEGPSSLFKGGALPEKVSNLFGRGAGAETTDKTTSKIEKAETGIKYSKGFPGATAVFNGLNYGEMKELLVKDDNHMKIDPDKYETLVNIFKNGSKKNTAGAEFLESIGKNDDKHMIDLALEGMGTSWDNIQDDSNKDKKFNETASESIARLASVAEYMEEKQYNKLNSETQYLVEKYIREGKDIDDLKDLDARGDVFYKETIVIDNTGLKDKIKTIANGNTEKEEELLLAINTFYNKMPNADKKIDLTGAGSEITFKTYDQTSTINLEKKSLKGFTPSSFSSYYELFKAASLTNYIKKLCKDKEATTAEPFHISTPGGDIEFADPSLFKFDTEIVSAGMGGSLKEISPILETYKKEYCTYLNTLKFWKQKATA
ncbi:MAG: hypothetical protein WC606_04110 [Candidatus Absconditabacterales bacterium]